MFGIYLKSKIHMAVVTGKNLNYTGSIEIDEEIMKLSNVKEGEMVLVANVNNGERFLTYVIRGEKGSRKIVLNGAAARKAEIGDRIIIMSFAIASSEEYVKPVVVILNEKNEIVEVRD